MALNRALIVLGPPGAGKGTQSRRIAQLYNVPHLSTGDMLRDAINRGTELGKIAQPIMERGDLVSDELIMAMVEQRLSEPDCSKGFVFDGFPRTLKQAAQLDAILESHGFGKPIVVDFAVPEDKLLKRLTGRWMCSVDGETYNIYEKPPKVAGICDADGGTLIQRADDRPEAVKERLAVYERKTKPLTDYYESKGLLERVDAGKSVEEVNREVRAILNRVDGQHGRV